jgi:hypothetical protein
MATRPQLGISPSVPRTAKIPHRLLTESQGATSTSQTTISPLIPPAAAVRPSGANAKALDSDLAHPCSERSAFIVPRRYLQGHKQCHAGPGRSNGSVRRSGRRWGGGGAGRRRGPTGRRGAKRGEYVAEREPPGACRARRSLVDAESNSAHALVAHRGQDYAGATVTSNEELR